MKFDELLEERAAIIEYLANVPREEAERLARAQMRVPPPKSEFIDDDEDFR